MSQVKPLLELREKIKAKKPQFIRQDYEKRMKVHKEVWRKPKGLHSKIRHHIKGKRKMPSPGYKSPSAVRGLHSSGLKQIIVHNLNEIPTSKEFGIIISGKVGIKKKVEIIKKSNELGIKVLNIDADAYLKKVEEFLAKKKEKKGEKVKETSKEAKETQKEKKAETEQTTPEQKKKEEKEEKDKILTKKV